LLLLLETAGNRDWRLVVDCGNIEILLPASGFLSLLTASPWKLFIKEVLAGNKDCLRLEGFSGRDEAKFAEILSLLVADDENDLDDDDDDDV
jgi:hypothetical protein